jgi:hypothetical protein
MAEWIDPQQGVIRMQAAGGAPFIVHNGVIVSMLNGHLYQAALPAATVKSMVREFSLLRQGGFSSVSADLLARRRGPILHVVFAGHPVLRFDIQPPDAGVTTQTIWFDAQTRLVTQEEWRYPSYIIEIDRYVRRARLAPYTLPAGFFDPLHTQHSLWDRLSGWLQAHLPYR